MNSYADLGQAVAGSRGRFIVLLGQMSQCLGVSILYLVLASENMNSLYINLYHPSPGQTNKYALFVIFSALLVWPTVLFRTMSEVAYVSIFGVISSLLVTALIYYESTLFPYEDVNSTTYTFESFSNAVGTMLFSYGAHALFPSIQSSMSNKKNFNYALIAVFVFVFLIYIVLSTVTIQAFGCNLAGNVLMNLQNSVFTNVITFSILCHVLMAYVLFMNPIFTFVEQCFSVGYRAQLENEDNLMFSYQGDATEYTSKHLSGNQKFERKHTMKSKLEVPFSPLERFVSIFIRSGLVVITLLIAVTLPFFGDIMAFIGCSSITISSVLIPIWLYTKSFCSELTIRRIFLHIVFAVISAAIGLYGSYSAAYKMYSNSINYQLSNSFEHSSIYTSAIGSVSFPVQAKLEGRLCKEK